MYKNALGLLINADVNKSFYNGLLAQGYLKNDPMPSVAGTKEVTISKITGRLANENTPEEYKVKTVGFNTALPADGSYTTISIDNFCGGKISPLTPPEQRQRVLLFSPVSITSFDTQDIIKRYIEQNKLLATDPGNPYGRLFPEEPKDYCEGRSIQQSDSIQVTTLLTKNQPVTTKFSL